MTRVGNVSEARWISLSFRVKGGSLHACPLCMQLFVCVCVCVCVCLCVCLCVCALYARACGVGACVRAYACARGRTSSSNPQIERSTQLFSIGKKIGYWFRLQSDKAYWSMKTKSCFTRFLYRWLVMN